MSIVRNTTQPRWFEDGRLHLGVGIEDTFVPQERIGHRKLDEYELTQHYHHWREDLRLAADAGASFVRWGVPWYLTEPEQGRFDFRWIDQVAEEMSALGLRCIVDLVHYGTPLWMENQFLHPGYPEAVAWFGQTVAERYRGVFDDFTPLNEPTINAMWCGRDGRWPPYLHAESGFVRVLMALVRGIVLTQRGIAEVNPRATFVHVDAGQRWTGENFPGLSRTDLEEWRFLATDLVTGRVDGHHPLAAYLTAHGACEQELEWLRENAICPDVMGVNYYPAFTTVEFDEQGREHPREAGAAGLEDLIRVYHERYGLPVAVTETSRTATGEAKSEWLEQSLAVVDTLRAEGMPLVGYTWFPFFTLVDWGYRDAQDLPDDWWRHMGLVDLERGPDNVLSRTPNEAFAAFAAEAAARR